MPAWIHNSTLMEVTEITMSTDQRVRLLSNIIIPQKDSIQIGTQCTPNATCTAVVWVQCWPPRHHIMIIVSILIGVIWINHFQSPYPFWTSMLYGSELVLYIFYSYQGNIQHNKYAYNLFYIVRLNKYTIVYFLYR